MTNKEKIIKYLQNNILCRLKPSEVDGVGCFAIVDIESGTNLFKDYDKVSQSIFITEELKALLDENVYKWVRDYYTYSEDKQIVLLGNQLEHMKTYINHSEEPNCKVINREYISTRYIKKDEEIFINYKSTFKKFYKLYGSPKWDVF